MTDATLNSVCDPSDVGALLTLQKVPFCRTAYCVPGGSLPMMRVSATVLAGAAA
jgi:hypothetical protein